MLTPWATALILGVAPGPSLRAQGDWTEAARRLLETAAGREAKRLQGAHRVVTERVDLVFSPGRIDGCPKSSRGAQAELFAARIEALRDEFSRVLGFDSSDLVLADPDGRTSSEPTHSDPFAEPSSRLHVYVFRDEVLQRQLCPRLTGLVHQGVGTKRFGSRAVYALHQSPKHLGTDVALHRNLVHNVTLLLLAAVAPGGWLGERGYGWLDAGIAHHFEAALVDGMCTSLCHHERSQPPLLSKDRWVTRARTSRARGEFAAFRVLFGKDTSRLTADDRLFAFALVRFLVTLDGTRLGDAIRSMQRGHRAKTALETAYGCSLAELESKFARWLEVEIAEPQGEVATRTRAALYVYTQRFVRPRHREVLAKAIAQRALAHESGWQIRRRKPVLALGPVKRAAHWKGERIVKPVPAAWPFAAVLEFEGRGEAVIDWTRRRRNSKDGGAWFLDPASTYVEHINAEVVREHDGDRSYLAVVDTPTGEVMQSNEFLVRGRVTRPGGGVEHVGWWIRFDTPRQRKVERWVEHMTPLVDWRLSKARLGATPWAVVLEPANRSLAVLGTNSVFTMPKIPGGMIPCVRK